MKITKELAELINKWRKILKLEDWDLKIDLEGDKKYKKIEKGLGLEPGTTMGLNMSTEEHQYSLIILKDTSITDLERYLVHELVHTILNETREFDETLIAMVNNDEVESVLKVRSKDILEKLVWKLTRIVLELNKK